jgi:hypothetical protein
MCPELFDSPVHPQTLSNPLLIDHPIELLDTRLKYYYFIYPFSQVNYYSHFVIKMNKKKSKS